MQDDLPKLNLIVTATVDWRTNVSGITALRVNELFRILG